MILSARLILSALSARASREVLGVKVGVDIGNGKLIAGGLRGSFEPDPAIGTFSSDENIGLFEHLHRQE